MDGLFLRDHYLDNNHERTCIFSLIIWTIYLKWHFVEIFGKGWGHINPFAAGGQFGQYKMMQKNWEMTKILSHGYSSDSTQWEFSNEYQHDRVYIVFKNLYVIVLWMKVALALEGLKWDVWLHPCNIVAQYSVSLALPC